MSDTPIDRLIFALDGDLGPLGATYSQAEAMTDRTTGRISEKWRNVSLGMSGMGNQAAFKPVADSASELERALGGVSLKAEEARRNLIASSGAGAAMTALFKDIAKIAPASMQSASTGINLTQRELWHLSAAAREIATGQFSRLPITAAVLAAHFGGLTVGTLALGAAILTIPVAFGVAAYQTEQALARIRGALALTGYASGITASQAGQIASAISAGSGGTYSSLGARGLVAQLSSGMVPGGSIGQAGIAATQYELGAGATEKDTVKLITDMFADPRKSAEQLDREMNLLSYAQTEQVRALQEQGEYEKAGDIILKAFSDRAKEAADQANYFAIMLKKAEAGVGGFIDYLGKKILGTGLTPKEELDFLQGGGQKYSYGVIPEYDDASRAARIAELQREIADQEKRARDNALRPELAAAGAVAEKGTGAFDRKVEEISHEADLLKKALADLTKAHQGSTAEAIRDRQSLEAHYRALGLDSSGRPIPGVNPLQTVQGRTPVALQQQATADALAAAATPPGSAIPGRLKAQADLMRDLADPTIKTADAYALYASRLKEADAATIRFNEHAGVRMDQHIKDLLGEAAAAETVARAFDESVVAGDRAKAAGEAANLVTRKEISAKMELAATNAILTKSFSALSAAESERIAKDTLAVATLRAEAAAGGSPVAQALAGARAQATAETATEFAAANALPTGTPEQVAAQANALKEAGDHFNKALANNIAKLDAAAQREANSQMFRLQTEFQTTQQRAGLLAAGGTPDDIRRLEAAQAAVAELARTTDVYDLKNRALVESTMQAAVAVSDLNDSFQKMQKEANDLASDVTGPLESFLNFKTDAITTLKQIFANIYSTVIKNTVIEPLQKDLSGLFGGLLGAGAPGSSIATPSYTYVVNMPAGAPGGGAPGGGSPGGLGGIFDSIFGGGATPDALNGIGDAGSFMGGSLPSLDFATSSGGFFADIGSWLTDALAFIGLEQGGPATPGNAYIVGERGMELFVPSQAGYVVPNSMLRRAANANVPPAANNVTHIWNFNGPTDGASVLRSRGQMEAAITRMSARGNRNT